MTENKNVETILKNGDKALSGMPYLYRSKGLPSEVYDVRMREGINGELLKLAIADTGEQVRDWLDKFVAAAKASSQVAKERAEAARNMSPQITALYYDAASGTMKSFDPTKNTQEEMQKLVENAPSLFIS